MSPVPHGIGRPLVPFLHLFLAFESPYVLKNTPKKKMLGLNHHVKKKNMVSGSRLLTLEGS
jgi:hypothetical protein